MVRDVERRVVSIAGPAGGRRDVEIVSQRFAGKDQIAKVWENETA